ncbi:MAG: hypothetical protein ACE5NM_11560, partial [Sedimentisphaerales bacterium]
VFASAEATSELTPPQPPQVEAVKKAAKEAQKQARAAHDQMESMLAGIRMNLERRFTPSGAGTVLVIPAGQIEAEDFAKIIQDLNVMSAILDKKLQQAHIPVSEGFFNFDKHVWRLFGRDSRATEAIYLQDYGAIFLVKVDLLLQPPPQVEKKDKQAQVEEPLDPVWDQTLKELYEPERISRKNKVRPEEKYDAEKVENLKTTLIKALKHAANIRSLKPDDSVIITVKGSAAAQGSRQIEFSIPMRVEPTGYIATTIAKPGQSRPAILVIRAKKSDIDAFSKDELDYEHFRNRVQIFTQ